MSERCDWLLQCVKPAGHEGKHEVTSLRTSNPEPTAGAAAEEPSQECPQCAGTGCAPNHLSDTCGACGGTGMRSTDDSDDELPAPAGETGEARCPFDEQDCLDARQLLRECEEALSTVGCHPDGEALAQAVLKKLRARAAPPEGEGT